MLTDNIELDASNFGLHVTTRKANWMWWLLFIVFVVVAGFTLLVAAVTVRPMLGLGGVSHRNQAESLIYAILVLLVCSGLAWLIWRLVRCRYEFYERGVIMMRGKHAVREMAYASVRKFTLETIRQYINGIYAGTTLRISLKDELGTTVSFSGRHKERTTLLGSTILHKSFKGEDEMDILRFMIAKEMLPHLSRQLATAGNVEWCEKARISATGVTPARGKLKKTEVPFSQIKGVGAQAGAYHAFRENDKRSFLFLSVNSPNFWPGLLLFEQLMEQHHADRSDGQIPEGAQADDEA